MTNADEIFSFTVRTVNLLRYTTYSPITADDEWTNCKT